MILDKLYEKSKSLKHLNNVYLFSVIMAIVMVACSFFIVLSFCYSCVKHYSSDNTATIVITLFIGFGMLMTFIMSLFAVYLFDKESDRYKQLYFKLKEKKGVKK